jgi:hypothetical protein
MKHTKPSRRSPNSAGLRLTGSPRINDQGVGDSQIWKLACPSLAVRLPRDAGWTGNRPPRRAGGGRTRTRRPLRPPRPPWWRSRRRAAVAIAGFRGRPCVRGTEEGRRIGSACGGFSRARVRVSPFVPNAIAIEGAQIGHLKRQFHSQNVAIKRYTRSTSGTVRPICPTVAYPIGAAAADPIYSPRSAVLPVAPLDLCASASRPAAEPAPCVPVRPRRRNRRWPGTHAQADPGTASAIRDWLPRLCGRRPAPASDRQTPSTGR